MIYLPDRRLDATPDAAGLSYEDVFLTTTDGVRIHGWFLPAPHALPPSPFTLLFFHGNAGNISHRLDKLVVFHKLGANALIMIIVVMAAAKASRARRVPITTPKLLTNT